VAAHSKGLNAINRIFQKSRQKTVTETISIPYRHGILHGMDLGYDNRMVAAKCWAALFAAREWALKAERGQLVAPPEEPKKTWREVVYQLRENQRQKELLEKWQPRTIEVGTDVPASGAPDMYEDGTPERMLSEYLYFWMRRNYGFMARYVPNHSRISEKAAAGDVRERLTHMTLKSFEISSITDVAAAVTEIDVTLVLESNGRETEQNSTFRLINQNAEGRTVIRGQPEGKWVIYNWGNIR
jgi:hypothetical protein